MRTDKTRLGYFTRLWQFSVRIRVIRGYKSCSEFDFNIDGGRKAKGDHESAKVGNRENERTI